MTAATHLDSPALATFQSLKAGLDVRAGGRIVAAVADAFATGFPALDEALSGGFPRGTLGTLEGAPSAGRTAIVAQMLARATRSGLAAFVDDGSLYPPDFERAGVDLSRLLVAKASRAPEIARSTDILLRSKTFSLVVAPAMPLRGTVWSRLCGLAQKSGALLLVLALEPPLELSYFASTRVRCAIHRVVWTGKGPMAALAGYELHAHVVKHKRAAPGALARLQIGAAS